MLMPAHVYMSSGSPHAPSRGDTLPHVATRLHHRCRTARLSACAAAACCRARTWMTVMASICRVGGRAGQGKEGADQHHTLPAAAKGHPAIM